MSLKEQMIAEIKQSKYASEFADGELESMEDSELLFNYTGIIRHDAWEHGYMVGYSAGYEVYSEEQGTDGLLKVQVETMDGNMIEGKSL